MKRILASFFIVFVMLLPMFADTDEYGHEFKETMVILNLLDSDYIDIEIGFKDLEGNILSTIDNLSVVGGHAESEPFFVYWNIVSGTSFNLYLKGSGSFQRDLDWSVETVPEDGSRGTVYFNGTSGENAYQTGGLLCNFYGSTFRASDERRIKILTEDFTSLSVGDFGTVELRVEIVSS